jgi:hypothetical protein
MLSVGCQILQLVDHHVPPRTHIGRMALPAFSSSELARIRQSLGLTVDEVAYLASVTPSQVRYLEEGSSNSRYRPSFDVLDSITAALHFHIMRRLKRREGVAPERRRKS